MRLLWVNNIAVYALEKLFSFADALSRSLVCCVDIFDCDLCFEVENHVDNAYLPVCNNELAKVRKELSLDPSCLLVIKYCENEWLSQSSFGHDLQPYYQVPKDLSHRWGLLLRSDRIIIPIALQRDVLNSIHDGHQGITKYRARA